MYDGTMEVVPGTMTPITQYYNGQYQEPESQVLNTYSKCRSLEIKNIWWKIAVQV